MAMNNSTRQKVEKLANAVVNDSLADPSSSTPGWFVSRQSKDKTDAENDQPAGFTLTGSHAAAFLDALDSLEGDQSLEHLTRSELDAALVDLVLDLYDNRSDFKGRGKRKNKVDEFVGGISKPHDEYLVMFDINNIDIPEGSVNVGNVNFRKFTPSIAIEWGYERTNHYMQEMVDEVIGKTIGIASTKAGTWELAAERAKQDVDRALNVLRIQISAGRASRVWERQHRQERGQFRAMRKINPDDGFVSTGGSQITNPMRLELSGEIAASTKDGIDRLAPLYDGSIADKVRDSLILALEWIGTSITRESFDQRIVDLCVALEAVLTGINDRKKGEAIALRSMLLALSLGKTFSDPALILQLYETRSRIVHGAELDICGRTECDWLRSVSEEVIANVIQLASTVGSLSRPIHLIRHIETVDLLTNAISGLEGDNREPGQKILKYATSELERVKQAHGSSSSC